ncbi:MAG: hypothetical protein ACI35W_07780 [Anaeroplasmataceae bacterium]
MKKRLILLSISSLFVIGLTSCANNNDNESGDITPPKTEVEIDEGEKISSITIKTDSSNIEIKEDDDPIEVWYKLKDYKVHMRTSGGLKKNEYSSRETKYTNAYFGQDIGLFTGKIQTKEKEEFVDYTDYMTRSTNPGKLLAYSCYDSYLSVNESDGTNDLDEYKIDYYRESTPIDSSSEYYIPEYSDIEQFIYSNTYYKNYNGECSGKSFDYAYGMTNQEEASVFDELSSKYSNIIMFGIGFISCIRHGIDSYERLNYLERKDLYDFKFSLTDKYLIIEQKIYASLDDADYLPENKDDYCESYKVYIDYNSLLDNTFLADYCLYETSSNYVNTISNNYPNFPEEYHNIEGKSESKSYVRLEIISCNYTDKDIDNFKEAIVNKYNK